MKILPVKFIYLGRISNIGLFIFFLTITFVFYNSSLNNFFVLDDFVRIKAASIGSLSENFHFFPVPLIFYRIIYLVFGLNPLPLRVLNFTLNAVACLIVFNLSNLVISAFVKEIKEIKRILISFFTALLFCIHYIHVETVVYYSELHEMFYSVFYLAGLFAYLLYKKDSQNKFLYWTFFFYALSLFSKETAGTFVLCIFLSEKFIFRNSIKLFIEKFYPLILITIVFVTIRYFFFPNMDVLEKPESFLKILSEVFKNYIFSFTAFIFSLDFVLIKNIYRANDSHLLNTLANLIITYPIAIFSISAAGVLYAIILLKRDTFKYISLCFSFIIIMSFAWIAGYERYLYLPSFGFWLMVTYFLFTEEKLNAFNKIPLYIILAVIIVYNVVHLEQKESEWITASDTSRKIVTRIIELTKELPSGSRVYFENLPGEYKSAWVLRYGIHEIPSLFLKRNDIEFYYYYQKPAEVPLEPNIYIYDYTVDKLYTL